MRLGLMIGPERGRYSSKIDRLRADARWAEEAGMATIWIPQIPDELDALTAAALVGVETSRIEIGTAVVPVQPRHPIALAQQALSTQAACGGRLSLGLGVSHHWIIDEMLGLPYERVKERVLAGGSDDEVLAWALQEGRGPDEQDREVWNAFMLKRGWRDEVTDPTPPTGADLAFSGG